MNKINVTENLEKNKLHFEFLNGSIELNNDEYGSYALSTGCGSGKTTAIKQLINLKWTEGILYSAFTKDEVNSMYQYCKSLVGTSNNGVLLKDDDIIVLHSDYSSEGTDNNLWKNHPDELMNKKIILCTHAKLLDEPINILLETNFNQDLVKRFPPVYRVTHGIGSSLPRQWVLIDESMESRSIYFPVSRGALVSLGSFSKWIRVIDEYGNGKSIELEEERLVKTYNHYGQFVDSIKRLSKYLPSVKSLLKPEDCELNRLRNEQLFESLYNDFELYANTNTNSEIAKVQYGFTNMIHDGFEKTHIILLDGTSDITLRNSGKFRLLEIPNKYNCKVNTNLFQFNLTRRLKPDKTISNYDEYVRNKLDKIVLDLSEIIEKNTKTLIFTWKDLKSDNSEVNDDVDTGLIADINNILSINKNLNLPEYIKFKLEELGHKSGYDFSIEYYGSGKDKAINDYRDYDAVVLAGEYIVPNSVISDFNLMYRTNITSIEYYSNRAIQAICRTRIRKHEGGSVNLYISTDWSGNVINYITKYLNSEITGNISSEKLDSIDRMYNDLRSKGISPKKAEQIAKLSTIDYNIFNSIVNNMNYSCSIRLDEIYSVIPMSRKEVDKYNKISNWINKLGINLSIINSPLN